MTPHDPEVWVGGVPNLLSLPVTVFYNKDCEESRRAAKLASKHKQQLHDRLLASTHWMRKSVDVYENWWRELCTQ